MDDFSNFLSFDEGTEKVPKPSSDFYTSFRKPSMTQPQNLALTGQAPPNKFGSPREKAVGGGSMKWDSKLYKPISVPARQEGSLIPAAVQSQFTPLDTYANRNSVSQGVAGTSASSKKVPSNAFTSLSIVPPISQSWPTDSQTGKRVGVSTVSFPKVDLGSSQSRGGSRKIPKLLHEDAFDYNSGNAGFLPKRSPALSLLNPYVHAKLQDDDSVVKEYGQSENFPWASSVPIPSMWNPSFQSTGPKSSPKDWMMVSPFSGAGRPSRQPQNSVTSNRKIKVLEGVSQPTLQSSSKKRIVHTKNGYKRGRVLFTKTAYTPEYEVPQMMDAMERPTQDSETWRKY